MVEPHIKAAWLEHAQKAHADHQPDRVVGIRHARIDKETGHKHWHDSVCDVRCSCGELVHLPFDEDSGE